MTECCHSQQAIEATESSRQSESRSFGPDARRGRFRRTRGPGLSAERTPGRRGGRAGETGGADRRPLEGPRGHRRRPLHRGPDRPGVGPGPPERATGGRRARGGGARRVRGEPRSSAGPVPEAHEAWSLRASQDPGGSAEVGRFAWWGDRGGGAPKGKRCPFASPRGRGAPGTGSERSGAAAAPRESVAQPRRSSSVTSRAGATSR
jgi:hypothetical protein